MNIEELIDLYKKMYELTLPECKKCRVPLSCCSPEYCDMAEGYAKEEWGVELKPLENRSLKFLDDDGCIVPPHLRPMCTMHTCGIGGMGTSGNIKWDQEYWKLRDKINELEYERNDVENGE